MDEKAKEYAQVYLHLKRIEDKAIDDFYKSIAKVREQKRQVKSDLLTFLGLDGYQISDYRKCKDSENPIGFCVYHPEDDWSEECFYCRESEF